VHVVVRKHAFATLFRDALRSAAPLSAARRRAPRTSPSGCQPHSRPCPVDPAAPRSSGPEAPPAAEALARTARARCARRARRPGAGPAARLRRLAFPARRARVRLSGLLFERCAALEPAPLAFPGTSELPLSLIAPLQRMSVENFRAARHLTLELDPRVTVLFGANAAGKTTLLDALAIGLGAAKKSRGVDRASSPAMPFSSRLTPQTRPGRRL